MKKAFLFILPFLFLTVISCGFKNLTGYGTGSVSFSIGQNVSSQLARNIFDGTEVGKEIDLTVTLSGDYESEQTKTINLEENTKGTSFTFNDIPGDSVVSIYIKITRSSDKKVMYTGTAENIKVAADKPTQVSIKLKPVEGVPEITPTIEILLGDNNEPQESLSLIEILGDYFIPSDTKLENYNYYSSLAEAEDYVSYKNLWFRVDNWDSGYKITLNDKELTVDEEKFISYTDVLAAAKTGKNTIQVTKNGNTTEAASFEVSCGIFDVTPMVFLYTDTSSFEDAFGLEDGTEGMRIGVDANKTDGTTVSFYAMNPYSFPETKEAIDRALLKGIKINYSVIIEDEEAEISSSEESVETSFGLYKVTVKQTVIPSKAKKNILFNSVFEIPEAYAEKDENGKPVVMSSTSSLLTTYDVTTKGEVFYDKNNETLFYAGEDNPFPESFSADTDNDDDWEYLKNPLEDGDIVPVKDFCFDEFGDLIYDNGENGLSYEDTTPYLLTYDYDNSALFGLYQIVGTDGTTNKLIYFEKEDGAFTNKAGCSFPGTDYYNPENTEITAIAVNNGYIYIASSEKNIDDIYMPVIRKFEMTEPDDNSTFELVYSSTLQNLPRTITNSYNDNDHKCISITDLEIKNFCLFAIANQHDQFHNGTEMITASRGCLLEIDLDLNYARTTGWENGNELTVDYYIEVSPNFTSGTTTLESLGLRITPNASEYDTLYFNSNPVTFSFSKMIYAPDRTDTYNFIAPCKFVALEPKKLVVSENGCIIYVNGNDFKQKGISSFATVNLEKFAYGVESRKLTNAGGDELYTPIGTASCTLTSGTYSFQYSSCTGDLNSYPYNWYEYQLAESTISESVYLHSEY